MDQVGKFLRFFTKFDIFFGLLADWCVVLEIIFYLWV